MELTSILKQQIDELSIKYGRHQIAEDLNAYRKSLGYWRIALEDCGVHTHPDWWDKSHIIKEWSNGNSHCVPFEDEDHDMPIYMEREDYEVKLTQLRAGATALVELSQHFPRPHGRACLSCGDRPVLSYYGQRPDGSTGWRSNDFCRKCEDRINERGY